MADGRAGSWLHLVPDRIPMTNPYECPETGYLVRPPWEEYKRKGRGYRDPFGHLRRVMGESEHAKVAREMFR